MASETPSRFLFTTIDAGGNVPPTMALLAQLVKRGHQVRVMSDGLTREEAEAAGAAFRPWRRAPNNTVRSRETAFRDWDLTAQEAIKLLVEHHACRWAQAFAGDVVEELTREPADVIVSFDALLGAIAAGEARRTGVAVLSTGLSMAPLPGIPPMGTGLVPAKTEAEHAHLASIATYMWSAGLSALNAARVALGLEPLRTVLEQYERADLRILGTAHAFDFPSAALPANVRYAGPLIRDPVCSGARHSPWPSSDSRPLVLVGFSTSFQDHIGCLQRVIDACGELPVRTLVTLGGSIHAGEVRAANNTVIVDHAPHTAVMREASLVVTHGGHGTVMTALVNRLPLLILPHGRDQGDNAVRVTERGAGLSLPNTASREEMGAALKRLIEDASFKAAAARLGDAVAGEAERSTIVAELETLARLPASTK